MTEPDSMFFPDGLSLDSQSVLSHFVFGDKENAATKLNFLLGLDRADTWAVDHAEYSLSNSEAIRLKAFLGNLELVIRENAPVLEHSIENFVDLLAGLTTSRCMVILRYVSHINERFIDALAEHLELVSRGDVMARTVLQRLEVFERGQLLARIFSGRRLLLIKQVMRSYRDVA